MGFSVCLCARLCRLVINRVAFILFALVYPFNRPTLTYFYRLVSTSKVLYKHHDARSSLSSLCEERKRHDFPDRRHVSESEQRKHAAKPELHPNPCVQNRA